MIILILFIVIVGLYIEYIICQTEKLSIVFVCNLIFNLLSKVMEGTLKETFASVISIFDFSITVFLASLIVYVIYKKTKSFKSFAILYFVSFGALFYLLSLFFTFIGRIFLTNSFLAIGLLVLLSTFLIVMFILMCRNYAMPSKNKNEEVTYISAPAGCPRCGRGLESDMTSCPYWGYNFETFTNMYKEAVKEKNKKG